MRIATTEGGSLCAPMKKLTAFLGLESVIRADGPLASITSVRVEQGVGGEFGSGIKCPN